MAPELGLAVLLAGEEQIDRALGILRGVPQAALFLMHTGVRALEDARLQALVDDGLEASACAMDAEAHGFRPREGGPRFGSQYDHAVLVRDARRLLALTPRRASESRVPEGDGGGPRRVRVTIGCPARDPAAAQALRSAVAYAVLGLAVEVAIAPEAAALLAHRDHPPAVLRALGTLAGLGRQVRPLAETAPAPLEVAW